MLTDKSDSMDKDSFFRSIDSNWYEDYNGDTESSFGWFGLLYIDREFRDLCAEHEAKGNDQYIPDGIVDGVYLVQINSDGIVCAYQEDSAMLTQEAFEDMSQEYDNEREEDKL